MKFKIFFFFALFSFCYAQSEHIVLTPHLQMVLDDMKLYKLDSEGESYLHAGDLYEHSVWSYHALLKLFETDSPYVQNLFLTLRQKEVIALAALLHDIGKSGRLDLFERTHPTLFYDVVKNDDGTIRYIRYFQDRQTHPVIGFEYAAKHLFDDSSFYVRRDYYAVNQRTGDLECITMQEVFTELGLTLEEQKIVAILIGIHYEFGNLKHKKISVEKFLSLIADLVRAVDYNDGIVDEYIVRLSMLIQVADVKGLIPVELPADTLFLGPIVCVPTHSDLKFEDPFLSLGYAMDGNAVPEMCKVMDAVLVYFHDECAHMSGLMHADVIYA